MAAKKKKTTGQRPTYGSKIWSVISNGTQMFIIAGHVLIVDGALILETRPGGNLIQAFAPGAWTSIATKEEPDAEAT